MTRFLITEGLVYKNTEGYDAVVVGRDGNNIHVQFQDSHKATVTVKNGNLKMGHFSNPYHISVAGFGYYGQGPFVAKEGGKHTEEYEHWNSMLKRCYKSLKHQPSYYDKHVNECWRNFQVFAEWAIAQRGFGLPDWHLDKDLLIKGNVEYGPETCVYLPREINSFIKRKRMNALPIGVDIAYHYNGTPYFRTQAVEDGKNIVLGRFEKVEDAFNAYKSHKEMLAQRLAEKWKDKIDSRAYEALLNYTVEITD
jgi:hypothetical protein